MEDFKITQEEKALILKRRELFEKRKQGGIVAVQKQTTNPATAAANGSKCAPHQGRVTDPSHEMHWFEQEIFSQIGNMNHQKEHRKILEVIKMPVQSATRDRIFHQLCHLDVLWKEGRLPVKYKHKYEEYKKKYNIDDTNLHPDLKEEGREYPTPFEKRAWNPEDYQDYDKNEKFIPTKVYDYAKAS